MKNAAHPWSHLNTVRASPPKKVPFSSRHSSPRSTPPTIPKAIEEIEARKEKRKREEAALARARGGAAAAAAATTAAAALLALPPAQRPSATEKATTAAELRSSPDVPPPLPRTTDEKSQTISGNPGDPAESKSPSCTAVQQEHVAVNGPTRRQLPMPPVSVIGGASVLPASATPGMNRVRSAAALQKTSTTFGVETTLSASRLVEQYTPLPSPRARPSSRGLKKKKPVAVGLGGDSDNNNTRWNAMYENMAVEV